ncbi:hypothetical protein D3C76_1789810 [compost metagenome]
MEQPQFVQGPCTTNVQQLCITRIWQIMLLVYVCYNNGIKLQPFGQIDRQNGVSTRVLLFATIDQV